MSDRDQSLREKAYKIWEDEGRPEGLHDDHWRRAEEQHEAAEQASEDVTKANQDADKNFDGDSRNDQRAVDIRPPSTLSPD